MEVRVCREKSDRSSEICGVGFGGGMERPGAWGCGLEERERSMSRPGTYMPAAARFRDDDWLRMPFSGSASAL